MTAQLPERTGIITEDMRRVVREQRLGFVATVCPDGTPNLSPKGTTAVWDDEHLVFADLRSPRTVANLRRNPNVEVNVVDPVARKGYRFKGAATVLTEGPLFEDILDFYVRRGAGAGCPLENPPCRSGEGRAGPPAHLPLLRPGPHRGGHPSHLVGPLPLAPKPARRGSSVAHQQVGVPNKPSR
jgi:Pyridoxamine 5'-phosphate oxidase